MSDGPVPPSTPPPTYQPRENTFRMCSGWNKSKGCACKNYGKFNLGENIFVCGKHRNQSESLRGFPEQIDFDPPSESHTEQCSICMENENIHKLEKTFCNHYFHKECLNNWKKKNPCCPLCRTELPPIYKKYLIKFTDEYGNIKHVRKIEFPVHLMNTNHTVSFSVDHETY